MRRSDVLELLALAALWGASFLLMRMSAPQFGPVALSFVRVTGAALFLAPLLAWQGLLPSLRRHWLPIFIVGITNSALPFLGFSYAALAITGGLSAVFNAASPLFAALIAWLWLKDRLDASRVLGLFIGFTGVAWLVWSKASFKPDAQGVSPGLAVLACMASTVCYGFSAAFAKRHLAGVPPMAVAAGSQIAAAFCLMLPAGLCWPTAMPAPAAWSNALLLALLCTGVAYLLYFRLIASVGPANAISVTFLIPVFAVLWGWVFLGEGVSLLMALGCGVIVAGTSLVTGLIKLPVRRPAI